MNSALRKPTRTQVLGEIARHLTETDLVVAALAGTTTDCHQVMHRPGNLYLVGMGLVSQVAFGLALARPNWRVIALDTDGSMLLAPSILPVIAVHKPANLYILVFDNEQLYGSRGGPKSQTAEGADIAGMARAAGIARCDNLRDAGLVPSAIAEFFSGRGPACLVTKFEVGPRAPGPKMDGQENKYTLIRYIEGKEKIEILGPPKP